MIPVRAGQLYVEAGGRPVLWEVVQVIRPPSGLLHVRLRERVSRQRMLLSCRNLLERFRLLTESVPAAPARRAASPIMAPQALPVLTAPVLRADEAARQEVA